MGGEATAPGAGDPGNSRILVCSGDRLDPTTAFEFADVNQALYPMARMCRVLEVSPSGYYAWRRRGPSARAQEHARLSRQIQTIPSTSHRTYGVPRVHAELSEADTRTGRKGVAGLMQGLGLQGVSRRKETRTIVRCRDQGAAPNLVRRDFAAPAPSQLWVADIPYTPTGAGLLYLTIVLDAFRQHVVRRAIATHLHAELVLDALEMALTRRRPTDIVDHSNQRCQYTSIASGLRDKAADVRPSMGSAGDGYDNAMRESSFATLKCVLLDRVRSRNHADARIAVFQFIEGWLNPHRRHSALNDLSPPR